jgi:hypothetical protein
MFLLAGSAPRCSRWRFAAGLLIVVAAGCNRTESPDAAREKQFADNPGYKKIEAAKLSGKVTIDGQPPSKDSKLFVILNESAHLDENAKLPTPKLYAVCDEEGNFAFTTNERHDGAAVGKYVVTLNFPSRNQAGRQRTGILRCPS